MEAKTYQTAPLLSLKETQPIIKMPPLSTAVIFMLSAIVTGVFSILFFNNNSMLVKTCLLVSFLVMGIAYAFFLQRYNERPGSRIKAWVNWAYTGVVALGIYVALFILYWLTSDWLPDTLVSSICAFVLPFLVNMSWQLYKNINNANGLEPVFSKSTELLKLRLKNNNTPLEPIQQPKPHQTSPAQFLNTDPSALLEKEIRQLQDTIMLQQKVLADKKLRQQQQAEKIAKEIEAEETAIRRQEAILLQKKLALRQRGSGTKN